MSASVPTTSGRDDAGQQTESAGRGGLEVTRRGGLPMRRVGGGRVGVLDRDAGAPPRDICSMRARISGVRCMVAVSSSWLGWFAGKPSSAVSASPREVRLAPRARGRRRCRCRRPRAVASSGPDDRRTPRRPAPHALRVGSSNRSGSSNFLRSVRVSSSKPSSRGGVCSVRLDTGKPTYGVRLSLLISASLRGAGEAPRRAAPSPSASTPSRASVPRRSPGARPASRARPAGRARGLLDSERMTSAASSSGMSGRSTEIGIGCALRDVGEQRVPRPAVERPLARQGLVEDDGGDEEVARRLEPLLAPDALGREVVGDRERARVIVVGGDGAERVPLRLDLLERNEPREPEIEDLRAPGGTRADGRGRCSGGGGRGGGARGRGPPPSPRAAASARSTAAAVENRSRPRRDASVSPSSFSITKNGAPSGSEPMS